MTTPALETINRDFWDQQVPHVTLDAQRTYVILQDVIKKFSGVSEATNISRDTKAALDAINEGSLLTFACRFLVPAFLTI